MNHRLFRQLLAVLLTVFILLPLVGVAEGLAVPGEAILVEGPDPLAEDDGPEQDLELPGEAFGPTPAPELLIQNPRGVPASLTLGVKDTYAIDVKKLSKKTVTFTSSKPKIADVSDKGVITAKKRGVATITCKQGSRTLATISVTVVSAPSWVSLDVSSLTIGVQEGVQFEAQLPGNSASTLTWTSDNGKIVSVSGTGKLKGVKAGKAKVTVTTHNGKKASVEVTVKTAPKKVSLTPQLSMKVGDSHTLKAELPSKAASHALTWKSSRKSVATVDADGRVMAIAPGKAKITVTTYNKKKATCVVTVKAAAEPTPAPTPTAEPTQTATTEPTPTLTATAEPTPTPVPFTEDSVTVYFGIVPVSGRVELVESSVWVTWSIEGYGWRFSSAELLGQDGQPVASQPTVYDSGITLTRNDMEYGDYTLELRFVPSDGSTGGVVTKRISIFKGHTPVNWFEMSNGVVTKYTGTDKVVMIPDTDFQGNPIVAIGEEVFYLCKDMAQIIFPRSLNTIGDRAFACSGLTSVTIPDSVTSIGNGVFQGCGGLTSVTIPDSVTSIGTSAFLCCGGLTSVTIPDSVTSIGTSAFADCTGLTSVTIRGNISDMGGWVFNGCTGLTSVTITGSITDMGIGVFQGCTGLTSVSLSNGVTEIGMQAFSGCTALTSVNIPNSVKVIDKNAFADCTGLTSLDIPGSVTTIDCYAFAYCTGLTSLNISNGVTSIRQSAFEKCTGLTSVTIPASLEEIGNEVFAGCTGLTSAIFSDGVTSIPCYAFLDCTSLATVTIPASVNVIGSYAFSQTVGNEYENLPITIRCYEDSYAHRWAQRKGHDFVLIG